MNRERREELVNALCGFANVFVMVPVIGAMGVMRGVDYATRKRVTRNSQKP